MKNSNLSVTRITRCACLLQQLNACVFAQGPEARTHTDCKSCLLVRSYAGAARHIRHVQRHDPTRRQFSKSTSTTVSENPSLDVEPDP